MSCINKNNRIDFITPNLPHILQNIQPFFLHLIKSLNAFLLCADYHKAFVSFACPQCGLTHKFPITCKTRLCPSCGYKYSKSDILHYGLITVIHTFGRDLRWNPHVHAIVSLGGFNKYFAWKTLDYFHVNVIANQWKFIVLRLIQSGNYQNPIWKQKAKQVANKLYKENARLFFLVEGQEVNSTEGLLKHLGRYLAGAPIADYKIVNVTEKEVTFFFHDLAN
ncbi:transposase, partial [Fusobacterium necrophorum]|uniref:transposase n=1 Tax=Fusobacterium necrophorum TaxID=859 RepID=UPI00164DC197